MISTPSSNSKPKYQHKEKTSLVLIREVFSCKVFLRTLDYRYCHYKTRMSQLKKLPRSEVSISGEIPAEKFETYRSQAVKNIGSEIEIAGFRKGKVPENILVQRLGEEKILYEMAELALEGAFPALLLEHGVDPIGRPAVNITKIARENPLGFSITVAVMPEIALSDYKKVAREIIAEKGEPIEVSEKELGDAIQNIRKQAAQSIPGSEGDGSQSQLPELNDEFVKKLGDYKDVADLKQKLKEHLEHDKKSRAQSKRRMRILDRILGDSNMEIPDIIIEAELDKMTAQFKGDISQMGAKFEDYLKHIKKTEEDMRKEWRSDALKRSKIELVLHKIAALEKITPPEEEINKEVAHILEHYKDADPGRAKNYVTEVITNEKVLQFLEGQQ